MRPITWCQTVLVQDLSLHNAQNRITDLEALLRICLQGCRDPAFARVLVYPQTKHGVDCVVRYLVGGGIEPTAIDSNKSHLRVNGHSPAFATAKPGCL
jgi:hypothetical protein